jgi:glycerol-3-phosphate dehydrogenase
VIGGGITGAGVALDAASRGYSVALVERADFASGTSGRSSKLIHGGLRYLQNFDLGLVREALLERALMVNLAPHLVKPLPFLVPFFKGWQTRATGIGLNLYDVMASERLRRPRRGRDARSEDYWSPDRHRTLDAEEAVRLLPALETRKPTEAYLFYDCQTDDARLVLTVLGEAERFGAVIANRVEVTGLIEEEGGSAARLTCTDRVGSEALEVRADNVINATGVWADRIRPEELYEATEVPRIRPSRGTHITLARETLPVDVAAIVPAGSGRTIFVLPWLGRTLIGTTDRDYDGDLEHVAPDAADVEYLLEATNRFFKRELGASDLTGAYAGIRPLISTGDPKKSVDISRKAELFETGSGLVTITGGKLTTWRRMAKMAVDRIVEREGREAPCRTDVIQLGQPIAEEDLAAVDGVDADSRALLASRYGHAAHDVLALCEADPRLARRISPDLPDLVAEATFAARREQAQSVGDVLMRRTRLGLLDGRRLADRDSEGARAVAGALAGELGWDADRVESELDAWAREAAAEGLALP